MQLKWLIGPIQCQCVRTRVWGQDLVEMRVFGYYWNLNGVKKRCFFGLHFRTCHGQLLHSQEQIVVSNECRTITRPLNRRQMREVYYWLIKRCCRFRFTLFGVKVKVLSFHWSAHSLNKVQASHSLISSSCHDSEQSLTSTMRRTMPYWQIISTKWNGDSISC